MGKVKGAVIFLFALMLAACGGGGGSGASSGQAGASPYTIYLAYVQYRASPVSAQNQFYAFAGLAKNGVPIDSAAGFTVTLKGPDGSAVAPFSTALQHADYIEAVWDAGQGAFTSVKNGGHGGIELNLKNYSDLAAGNYQFTVGTPDGKTLQTSVNFPGKTAASAPAIDPALMKVHYGNDQSLELSWAPSSPAPDQYRVMLNAPSGTVFMGTVPPSATSVKFTAALLGQLAAPPAGWRVETRYYDGDSNYGRFQANLPLPPHMFLDGFGPHSGPSGNAGLDLVDLTAGAFNISGNTVSATLTMNQLPSSITANQAAHQTGNVEYLWQATFDADRNGYVNDGDLMLAATRVKTSEQPETGPITSIVSGAVFVYSNGASTYDSIGNATVTQNGNSLTIAADSGTVAQLAAVNPQTPVMFSAWCSLSGVAYMDSLPLFPP